MTPSGRVVVVGAGPAGLTLACELALAGVPCRVLERRAAGSTSHRMVSLHARTMELFDLRGRADPLVARAKHLARIRFSSGGSIEPACGASRFPYLSILPQGAFEDYLASWAAELGVEVIRGAEVHGLAQDADGVTVQVRGEGGAWRERASYVVGCDGGDSTVRDLAGIPFEGGAYDVAAVQADVRLGRPPADDVIIHIGPAVAALSIAYDDGWHRVICLDATRSWAPQAPALEELGAMMRRVAGRDLEPHSPRWLGRFQLHRRLATRYRAGRVLLAGDAAHLHSPIGGPGIHLSLEDTVNLGWKLAGVVHGWAPDWLLDTYESERRPAAEQVIEVTDRATRLLATGSGQLARYVGADPGHHNGHRAPDLDLVEPDGRVARLRPLLRDGRFLLVDLGSDAGPARVAHRWAARVRPVVADVANPPVADVADPPIPAGVTAMVVRPDGYVAWSTRATQPAVRARLCRDALAHWCGPAAVPAGGGRPPGLPPTPRRMVGAGAPT